MTGTNPDVARRVARHVDHLVAAAATAVLVTCSSLGEAAEAARAVHDAAERRGTAPGGPARRVRIVSERPVDRCGGSGYVPRERPPLLGRHVRRASSAGRAAAR
jgi:hypothetical protein